MESGGSRGEGGAADERGEASGDEDREENSSDREEGGEGEEGNGDHNSENAEEEESSDGELLMEQQHRWRERTRKSRKRRKQTDDGDDGGEPETVTGQIPRDILKRISPLCEKMNLSMREQLFLTMGFCQLSGNTMNKLRIAIDFCY